MNRAIGLIVMLSLLSVTAMAADVAVQVGTGPFNANGGSPPLIVGAVYDAGYIARSIWRAEAAVLGWRFWGSENYGSCIHYGNHNMFGFGFAPRLVLDLPVYPRKHNAQVWLSFGGGAILKWSKRIGEVYNSWTDAGVSILGRLNFRTGGTESFYVEAEHQESFDHSETNFDLIVSAGYHFRVF